MFMVLVVVSLVASVAMAANEPIKIKRGTAVLDGSLDEFIAAQAEIARFAPPEFASGHSKFDGPQDQSVVAYALYDDEWFYIAANVTDDAVVMERCNNYIFENDHFGFWFEGYQFGVAICNTTGESYMHQWMASNAAWDAIVVPYDGGWIVEAKVSIADLRKVGVDIKPGAKVQFAMTSDDADVSGGGWEGNLQFPATWTWNQPSTFATATFQ